MDEIVVLACVPIAAGLILVALGIVVIDRYRRRNINRTLSSSTPGSAQLQSLRPVSRHGDGIVDTNATNTLHLETDPDPSAPIGEELTAGVPNVSRSRPVPSSASPANKQPDTAKHRTDAVFEPVVDERQSAMVSANRSHLIQIQSELQDKYYTLSKRIAALDTDLGRALDGLSRQVLEEQREEYWNQREEIAAQMARIEEQLGR